MRPARRYNQDLEVIQLGVDQSIDELLYSPVDNGLDRELLELARTKIRGALDLLRLPESK